LSRNSSRKKAATAGTDQKPAAADPVLSTGGFSFSAPTEHVELPSGGQAYAEDHPLHGKDTVEIKYMTAKEEDILTSQNLLKKGLAIERLLESVILDKTINPKSLLVGDRNAILVAARITGFGAEYLTQITCPACTKTSEYEFDLSEAQNKEVTLPEDAQVTESGTYMVQLPVTGVNVELKLLNGNDESKLAALQESKRKNKLPETPLTDMLNAIIVSVNGNTERGVISEFISIVPSRDTRYLRKIYADVTPNIDMTYEFECPNCDTTTDVEVPFTVSFLWPRQ
jgi:hypothetical protein